MPYFVSVNANIIADNNFTGALITRLDDAPRKNPKYIIFLMIVNFSSWSKNPLQTKYFIMIFSGKPIIRCGVLVRIKTTKFSQPIFINYSWAMSSFTNKWVFLKLHRSITHASTSRHFLLFGPNFPPKTLYISGQFLNSRFTGNEHPNPLKSQMLQSHTLLQSLRKIITKLNT